MGLLLEQDAVIESLYRDMYASMCQYALFALGDRSLAEEAVQDTFRIACMKPESLLYSENRKGWLINTLKYVILNIRKSRARLNSLVISAMSVDKLDPASEDRDLDFDLYYSQILGQEDFKLLKMVTVDKYSMREVSAEMGITLSACKKRVQRAKNKLKNYLRNNS